MIADDANDRFAFHRASPKVSIDEYVRSRSIALGEWVIGRERVYLDKCFWIHLRDARTNRARHPGAQALLNGLARGVREGRLICPISDALFLELLKQTDLTTRTATAELIDELSCGVTLIPHPARVATEIAHFLHANTGRSVHALEHLVWSKVTNVLGIQHPVASAFAPAEQLVIQKAFFDHMWSFPLSKMIEVIGEAWPPESPYPALAMRLNRENAAHAHRMKSFAQVYREEVFGSLELAAPLACDVLHDMATKAAGRPVAVSDAERAAAIREVLAFLRTAIGKQPVKRALRTLHLGALLHAAVRWNRAQKMDANDLYDFHHAEAALGYCDAFLTDRPMHTLLTQKHLAIERDFPCRITSSVEGAGQWAE